MKEYKTLLAKLVSIRSVYFKERELGLFIFDYFQKKGLKTYRQKVEKDRENIIVEKGHGNKSVALYSHLDTISPGNDWQSNPFTLTIKGDRAYGLGAFDMKGGMTANILAFLNYLPKNYKLKLFFCADEENISKGAYTLINSEFVKDVECVISTEPALKYGLRGIVTGRAGRAIYEVIIKNDPVHFIYYDKKNDVNLFAAELIKEISLLDKKLSDGKKEFFFVRKISSSVEGLSLPPMVNMEFDSCILPHITHHIALNKLRKIGKKLQSRYPKITCEINFKQRETPFLESYTIRSDNKYFKLLKTSIHSIIKEKPITYFRSSVADENVFGANKMTVLGIGPEGANAHQKDEYVSLKSIEKLRLILNNFLSIVDKQI